MAVDLVFNNMTNYTPELGEKVRVASRTVAALLDPDQDDEVPLEAIATFCRLTRLSLLNQADPKTKGRSALIVCDMQTDFVNGALTVKVGNWKLQSTKSAVIVMRTRLQSFIPSDLLCFQDCDPRELVAGVNKLRDQVDTVIFVRDWHPISHCSFSSSTAARRPSYHRASLSASRSVLQSEWGVEQQRHFASLSIF